MAFLDRFSNTDQYSLYGSGALNSGLNLTGIKFNQGVFSFLKLHGSVGLWVADFPGDPLYQQEHPKNRDAGSISDTVFFTDTPTCGGATFATREPVLFFPTQRQPILSTETGFVFRNFAKAVWDRATELISNATDIHVIGYLFSGIDQGPILDLLDQARNRWRIVIQGPDSDEICNRLKFERPSLRAVLESAPFTF
jgi:hypothetical protein